MSAVLAVFLVGCGALPQKYDNNEYEMLVRFAVKTEMLKESCDNPEQVQLLLSDLTYESRVIDLYAEHTPANAEVATVTKILADDIKQFKAALARTKTGHSRIYCKRKADIIYKKVDEVIKTVPKKLR